MPAEKLYQQSANEYFVRVFQEISHHLFSFDEGATLYR
jgi:hypothetical protein